MHRPRTGGALSRLGRGGFHLGVAAVASGSTPAKAAAMRPTLGVLNIFNIKGITLPKLSRHR